MRLHFVKEHKSIQEKDNCIPKKRIYIIDCDAHGENKDFKNVLFMKKLPEIKENPIRTGIENLFSKESLKSLENNKELIEQLETSNKSKPDVPGIDQWKVKDKTALCDSLCDKGEKADFKNFKQIIDEIQAILNK